MDAKLEERLVRDVASLRELLSSKSTDSVVGMCAAYWLRWGRDEPAVDDLVAPAKQWLFLLGQLMSTPEPETPVDFDEADVERSKEILNGILNYYAFAYFQQPDEVIDDEWVRTREVVMPTFLSYHTQGLMASTDQVAARVTRYLTPFDNDFAQAFGISASRALEVSGWIAQRLQAQADELGDLVHQEQMLRAELVRRAKKEQWDFERFRSEASQPPYFEVYVAFTDRLQAFSCSWPNSCKHSTGKQHTRSGACLPSVAERLIPSTSPPKSTPSRASRSSSSTLGQLCVRSQINYSSLSSFDLKTT